MDLSTQIIEATWFGSLCLSVLVWFVVASRLFRLLRSDHPNAYEALGSPSLFYNNSIRHSWLGLKFLFSGAYRELDDRRVTKICNFMRVFFVVYTILFFGPLFWMIFLR